VKHPEKPAETLYTVPELESGTYRPSCNLAHELVNKLAAIVGYCDLVEDHAAEEPECHKHLEAIRKIATGMAEALAAHQCDLDDLIRQNRKKKRSTISLSGS
jgi:hypothetical protein